MTSRHRFVECVKQCLEDLSVAVDAADLVDCAACAPVPDGHLAALAARFVHAYASGAGDGLPPELCRHLSGWLSQEDSPSSI